MHGDKLTAQLQDAWQLTKGETQWLETLIKAKGARKLAQKEKQRTGQWLRKLGEEGVEPNPGPMYAQRAKRQPLAKIVTLKTQGNQRALVAIAHYIQLGVDAPCLEEVDADQQQQVAMRWLAQRHGYVAFFVAVCKGVGL